MDHAEAFTLDQIPLTKRTIIPATLKTAYAAAKVLIDSEPILQVSSAADNRGRIIQWAVDLAFERLLKSGEWAYDFKWEPFAKPTGRFLQIMPSHSVVTISQVADPKKQPRDVVFRSNRRLNNQGWLAGLPNPKAQTDTSGLPHILLIHGHQELNFAHLAVPSEHHTQGYRHRSSNLMMMPYEVKSPEAPVEDTDIEAIMTLKEEIDKWRRDNGQQ